MPKNEVLYVKGMASSASETEGASGENNGDMWDDKKLNEAYDKALKIANAEVARRVAMSTNTQQGAKGEHSKSKHPQPKPSSKKLQWKVGMPCRAIYEEDQMEYEASLVRIINKKECVVRFIGFENSELVAIADLKPTLGKDARRRQIEQAEIDDKVSGMSTPSHSEDGMLGSDTPMSAAGSTESTSQKKNKKSNKKRKSVNANPSNFNGMRLPAMPGGLPMPDAKFMRKIGSLDMPIPPPPLLFAPAGSDCEDQAVSAMLLSWYMSGYYTGLYQGLKRSRANNRKS